MLTIDQIRPCKIEPGLNNVLELSFPAHIILQGKHKAADGASQRAQFTVHLSSGCLNNHTMYSHCCTALLMADAKHTSLPSSKFSVFNKVQNVLRSWNGISGGYVWIVNDNR